MAMAATNDDIMTDVRNVPGIQGKLQARVAAEAVESLLAKMGEGVVVFLLSLITSSSRALTSWSVCSLSMKLISLDGIGLWLAMGLGLPMKGALYHGGEKELDGVSV
jgi:hypothetical protein